ncbi:MAG: DUF1326 domain-containing protein [Rubrobacter sp.]|nr:DUF1326 domain-containing protein [Rubrobacter sp.]
MLAGRRRLYDIQSGEIDGVDVSGTKVALVADWPSGFLAGNGTGRLYFDPSGSQSILSEFLGEYVN